jgi:hypothetical protein
LSFHRPESSVPISRATPGLSFFKKIGTVMAKTSDFYDARHGDFDTTVPFEGVSSDGEDNNETQIRPVETSPSKGVSGADEIAFKPSNIALRSRASQERQMSMS